MNILFIDDEDYRHDLTEQKLGDQHCIFHAFDYTEAVSLLENKHVKYGVVMFDHDLGGGRDGSAIAGFVLNKLDEDRFPAQAIVHSLNPTVARNIESKLTTAGITTRVEPFSVPMLEWLKLYLQPQ
jgi:DNA-binding NtrC family response regulator